jgi:hypothetical protein
MAPRGASRRRPEAWRSFSASNRPRQRPELQSQATSSKRRPLRADHLIQQIIQGGTKRQQAAKGVQSDVSSTFELANVESTSTTSQEQNPITSGPVATASWTRPTTTTKRPVEVQQQQRPKLSTSTTASGPAARKSCRDVNCAARNSPAASRFNDNNNRRPRGGVVCMLHEVETPTRQRCRNN